MSYLNSLFEHLRRVAREIFPLDPLRTVYLTNINKYTRMYLRRIVQRAGNSPSNFIVTDLQLARLLHLPLSKFRQWFHYNVKLSKVFRRVRHFLREMIRLNILEDRGQLDEVEVEVIPIKWPNKKTMAMYQQQREIWRVEHQIQEPMVKRLTDAEEILEWIDAARFSTSSSEDGNESVGFGEDPDEMRRYTHETDDLFALNGPPAVVTDEELHDQFQKIIISDKLDDISSNDDEVFLPGSTDVSV